MRTIIELFDECQIKNVVAALKFRPQKIVFVGFKETMKKSKTEAIERFLKLRGLNIKIEYELVGRYSYDYIVKTLKRLVIENDDCGFDLTGGKELVLTAMGEISATLSVPMFQFNIKSGSFIRVKNCDGIPEPPVVSMSINECFVLNGGAIVKGLDWFEWELTDDFKSDIEKMWGISRRNPALWNKNSNILSGFDKTTNDMSGLFINAKYTNLPDVDLMKEFDNIGLISNLHISDSEVSFRYKNEQVHRVLAKAGNILELYVYILAKEIANEKNGFYDDIDTAVTVDWDGKTGNTADTINEIDVLMMRDLLPIFVSCKNGELHKEALYELETVADKFGGELCRKIVVTTYISSNESSKKYILQRAKDMKIDVIHNVHNISREEFKNVLKTRAI